MKLNTNDRLWAPMDKPRHLLVIPQGTPEPQTLAQFKALNAQLLQRLREEAGPEEMEEANRALDQLEPEVRDWLPEGLFRNRQTPELLSSLQLVEGSPLHQWAVEAEDALQAPQMPQAEAHRAVESLTLPSRVAQMLEA
jgi:hypothetical protein